MEFSRLSSKPTVISESRRGRSLPRSAIGPGSIRQHRARLRWREIQNSQVCEIKTALTRGMGESYLGKSRQPTQKKWWRADRGESGGRTHRKSKHKRARTKCRKASGIPRNKLADIRERRKLSAQRGAMTGSVRRRVPAADGCQLCRSGAETTAAAARILGRI